MSDDGFATQPPEHPGDRLIFVSPDDPSRFVYISEVQAVPDPHAHLVGRPQRHRDEASEFRFRMRLLSKSFRQVGADGFACPTDLIRQGPLLDIRESEAGAMHVQRYPIRASEHFQAFKRDRTASFRGSPLISDI